MAFIQDTKEDRGGQDVVAEDGAQLGHDLIGGDQEASALIAAGDQLKENMVSTTGAPR